MIGCNLTSDQIIVKVKQCNAVVKVKQCNGFNDVDQSAADDSHQRQIIVSSVKCNGNLAKTQWNSGINSTGILDSDWLTALTHVIMAVITKQIRSYTSSNYHLIRGN